MKRWKETWKKLSHKQKAALYLLATALLIPLLYCVFGFPSLTAQMAFRRAEQAAMVGPSTIIATEEYSEFYETHKDHPGNAIEHLIISKTGNGYILFPYTPSHLWDWYASLYYREKMGDITLMSHGIAGKSLANSHYLLSIYAFADHPQAIRAELELTHQAVVNGTKYRDTFRAEATREAEGYFRFELYSPFADTERELLKSINGTLGNDGNSGSGHPVTAVIRLYDKSDALIIEKEMEIYPYDTYGGASDEN